VGEQRAVVHLREPGHLFFLSLESNASLLHKANCVNINLGIDESSSCHNIDIMKEIELKNRTHFLDKNPEVSLPVNLDVGVNSELFPSLNSSSKGTDNPPFKDNNNSATKSWAKVLTDGLEASNNQMIGVVWNIRGLNKRGKLQCIADFIFDNKIDFVSFQETTKKKSFDDSFLGYVNRDFIWHCLPATGTVGGILVGLNSRKFEVLAWQNLIFAVSVMIKNCDDKFVWTFLSFYGSPYEDGKQEFINELHSLLDNWDGPTLIGGDFNLVANIKEKSNGVVNHKWVHLSILAF
jgi:hypothetical protein